MKLIDLTIDAHQILLVAFFMFLAYYKLNIVYYIKKLFKLKLTKRVMPLDCFPCLSFWVALIVTFNPFTAMAVYLFSALIDRK